MIEVQTENYRDKFPAHIKEYKQDHDYFYFISENDVVLRVKVIRDTVIQFTYGVEGQFEDDFSYAIHEGHSRGYDELDFEEHQKYFTITTEKIICKIDKFYNRVTILDLDGDVICEDEKGFHWEENEHFGGNIVKMSKVVQDAESFYGLGDKPTHLNLKGGRFENWGTDQYGFQRSTSPLYKNIPFYIGLHHGKSYGIFFDNTFKSFFDFASERRNATSFWAQGGEMNYYFIYGPEMQQVVESYADLTGVPKMPPMWALGFHQCKWSYYPDTKVKEIAEEFRKRDIPCDAIYLDIDYMDGFRCFTVNKEYFPDLKGMVSDLEKDGFKTVAIIDPGIKVDKDYWVFQEGVENDYFCKRADGPYMKGKVWPGDCYFPDFTNPEVREWWSGLFKELIADWGIRGVWNDMNEPAVMEVESKTFPSDVRHDYDGHPCSHRKAHNVYGMQMARATYHGVKKYVYPKRPFIITRSAYSGAQRYTSSWTGDNIASWEHLTIANIQCQRSAMSGFSFIGSDIGGFIERPTPELFARFIAMGSFHVFCRVHSSGDHGEQEPWSFGEEVEDISRKFIKLRYQLLPYHYTNFWKHVNSGTPIIRSLVMEDQEDVETHYRTDEFMVGKNILICPITQPNSLGRRVYLPAGRWYNYWNDGEAYIGGKEHYVEAPLDSIPFFVREGAIIPKFPVMNYVGEKDFDALILEVYHKNGIERNELFEDKGDGFDFKKGVYSHKYFKLIGTEKNLSIYQNKTGNKYSPEYEFYEIRLHGLPFEIKEVRINNQPIQLKDILIEKNTIKISKEFNELSIS